jgi:hypothetical protein
MPLYVNNLLAKCTTSVYTKDDGSTACGFFLQKGLTWVQANKQCFAEGGRLPTILSARENDLIKKAQVGYKNFEPVFVSKSQ